MITITEPSNGMKGLTKQSAYRKKSAFTVTELIVATAISGVVLASMVGTFITFAIGATSIGAYTEMSKDSRFVLEHFARDMRAADDVSQASATTLTVGYPATQFYHGSTVTYEFDPNAKLLFRIEKDSSGKELANEVLLAGVEDFAFSYYDPLGNSLSLQTPSILLSVKSVQVDAKMLRNVSRAEATDYIISARFMMRNRPVTK